jgi:hypothetical protein
LNNEGEWQEKSSEKTLKEAEKVKSDLENSGRTAIIVDLEKEQNTY